MTKGARRERQAAELYERAGFVVQQARGTRFGEKDFYGLFDFMAVRPGSPVHFVQVKSNRAQGIESWSEECSELLEDTPAQSSFLVCHDREGWRLIYSYNDGDWGIHVDERDEDGAMGDGVVDYLARRDAS